MQEDPGASSSVAIALTMVAPVAPPPSPVNGGTVSWGSHAHLYIPKKDSINWDFSDLLYNHEEKCATTAQAKHHSFFIHNQSARAQQEEEEEEEEVRRIEAQLEAVQGVLHNIKLTSDANAEEYRSPFAPGPDPDWYPHMLFEAKDHLESKLSHVSSEPISAFSHGMEDKAGLLSQIGSRNVTGAVAESVSSVSIDYKHGATDDRESSTGSDDTTKFMAIPPLMDDDDSEDPEEDFESSRLAMLTYRSPTPPLCHTPVRSSGKRQREKDDTDEEESSIISTPGSKRVRFGSTDKDTTHDHDEHVLIYSSPGSSATVNPQILREETAPHKSVEKITKSPHTSRPTIKIQLQLTPRNLEILRARQARATKLAKRRIRPMKSTTSHIESPDNLVRTQKEGTWSWVDI